MNGQLDGPEQNKMGKEGGLQHSHAMPLDPVQKKPLGGVCSQGHGGALLLTIFPWRWCLVLNGLGLVMKLEAGAKLRLRRSTGVGDRTSLRLCIELGTGKS